MDRKDLQHILSESLAVEVEDAKKAGRLGFMARALIQATLPHKATPSNEFVRDNGIFSLTIMAPSRVGLPFGSIPRLLLSWMTTESVFTRSPVLELGPTLSAFMAELGLARQGGKRGDITRFKHQAESLFCSTIHCVYADDAKTDLRNLMIADEASLWWNPKTPDQLPLWKSTVTLTDKFFKEIIERPVPVDMVALRALKRSPMALDIYFWLTYRLSYLSRDTVIPWPLLQGQFGADYAHDPQGQRNFKKFFIKRLASVKAIYEAAKVAPMERGLLLKPSPPHVPKRHVPMLGGARRGIESPSASETMAPMLAASGDILLQTETYAKAKRAAPGLDVYSLEQEWLEWITKTGKLPKDPDGAFIGFCKKKGLEHGGK